MKLVKLALFGLLAANPAGAGVIAELKAPEINDIQMTGFVLERESEVEIEAVGIRSGGAAETFFSRLFSREPEQDGPPRMSVYAWVLDADTRQPVWVMNARDTSGISGSLASAETTLRLDPGRYELYLSSTHDRMRYSTADDADREIRGFWDLFGGDRRGTQELLEDLAECHATLRVDGLNSDQVRQFEPTGVLDDAVLTVNRLGNSQFEVRGIEVSAPTQVRLYGAFEFLDRDDHPADFAWIVREDSREVAWRTNRKQSQPAGGATKNRRVEADLELEPGRYLLYVGTDDSHAFGAFNAAPPHDPLNWGLILRAGEKFTQGSVRAFQPSTGEPAPIDFSGARDNENLRQTFRLKRDGTLHLRAFGEYSDGEFYDRAWITDADSGKVVWQPTHGTTMPAGGAGKNRMFDGLVALPAGDYVLQFTSDGSHAYGSWNAATPFEPEAWGVVLRPGGSTTAGDIELIDG